MKSEAKKKLIKKIFAPLLVAETDEAHQLARSVEREGPGASLELEPGFFGSAVAFAIVARIAAGNEILPRRAAAARTGQHVVESKLRRRKCTAAELAGVAVAQQDILARKSAALLRNVPVAEQANHRGDLNFLRSGMHFGVIGFFGLRDAFQEQNERAANGRHVDWLERSVEDEHGRLHDGGPACGRRSRPCGRGIRDSRSQPDIGPGT